MGVEKQDSIHQLNFSYDLIQYFNGNRPGLSRFFKTNSFIALKFCMNNVITLSDLCKICLHCKFVNIISNPGRAQVKIHQIFGLKGAGSKILPS